MYKVLEVLNKLESNKTPGPDGLDPFLFKPAAPFIAEPSVLRSNPSTQLGEFPPGWKTASLLSLFEGD